uniref:Uncharacterized protein n=1 Tax=Glycine max TaxID=3847 RepID=A0A0R0FPW0_SOYBN
MAFAHYLLAVPVEPSPNFPTNPPKPNPSLSSSSSSSISSHCFNLSSSLRPKHSLFSRFRRICHKAKAKPQEPEVTVASDAFTQFKHLLLPITDRNPYLSEGTRQLLMHSRKSHCLSMRPNYPASVGIYLKVG